MEDATVPDGDSQSALARVANEKVPVNMNHLKEAAKAEYTKLRRPFDSVELKTNPDAIYVLFLRARIMRGQMTLYFFKSNHQAYLR